MQRKKKPNYMVGVVTAMLSLALGYYLSGLFVVENLSIDNVADEFSNIVLNPLPIKKYWNENSVRCMLATFTIWLVLYTKYLNNIKNYMFGKEFGSAEWANVKDFNRRLASFKKGTFPFKKKLDSENNRILSQNARISYNSTKTLLNNNQLVVGGSGAGKTAFFVSPNLIQLHGSNVYTDPKGGLLDDFGNMLLEKGHIVKALNICEMNKSIQYNPFKYIRKASDVQKLITNLLSNTTPAESRTGDPFWEKAETLYLMAIFNYVWLECPRTEIIEVNGQATEVTLERSFRTVLQLLSEAEVSDDEDVKSDLTIRMEQLELEHVLGNRHPAVSNYFKCIRGAGDTVRSIIISANSRFAPFDNEELLRILDDDETDLDSIGIGLHGDGKTKTSFFCIIPDDDDTFNFVIGMLYTQLFQELYRLARLYSGNKLPLDVGFWFDEFANIKMPASFDKILATCRSRGIYCTIILQSLAQLKALYKDKWEGLMGNCDTFVYLGGNEQSSHKYVSETLGKWTIDKRSTGESLGKNGSNSRNYDILGRELLTPDEVNNMDNRKTIIRVRGQKPILDNKWFLFNSPEYKKAKSLGIYNVKPEIVKDSITGQLTTIKHKSGFVKLDEESLKYYQNVANVENIKTYKLSMEDFLSIDFTCKTDSEDDILKVFEQNLDKVQEQNEQEERENLELDKISVIHADNEFEEDLKKLSVVDLIMKYDYSEDQQKEVQLGLTAGLAEKDIKSYMDISFTSTKMSIIRQTIDRSLERADRQAIS